MYPESVILVVGGQSNGNGTIARILSDHYRIVEAENLDDAMSHSENTDLVVSDLESPELDALQLLTRWKTERPHTPFLLVTDGSDVHSAVRAMKLGAADCIVRPVDPNNLRSLVSRLLDSNSDAHVEGPGDRDGGQKRPIDIPPGTSLEDLERAAVEQALTQHRGNRTHAAKTLGISVRTLQRKLKAWGMPLNSQTSNNPGSNKANSNEPGNGSRSGILYSAEPTLPSPFTAHVH
jgi:DNA-binding NtrC family response regulator